MVESVRKIGGLADQADTDWGGLFTAGQVNRKRDPLLS